tara:strand:+ start:883 stop:1077 length:195 start_codon:yes stop_codon:yes gene_type:complete
MDQNHNFTNEIIIGKSLLKKNREYKIKNTEYFERSILNFMIINNFNEKQKNKMFKKELNNNGYI